MLVTWESMLKENDLSSNSKRLSTDSALGSGCLHWIEPSVASQKLRVE